MHHIELNLRHIFNHTLEENLQTNIEDHPIIQASYTHSDFDKDQDYQLEYIIVGSISS